MDHDQASFDKYSVHLEFYKSHLDYLIEWPATLLGRKLLRMRAFKKLQTTLSRNVKVRRAELALSQEALAFKSGTERAQISQIERKLANPTLKTIDAIAEALETDAAHLLADRPVEW